MALLDIFDRYKEGSIKKAYDKAKDDVEKATVIKKAHDRILAREKRRAVLTKELDIIVSELSAINTELRLIAKSEKTEVVEEEIADVIKKAEEVKEEDKE